MYQGSTFQGSQNNWNALTKATYVNYMSFHRMVSYLKDGHVKIRCDHAPLCKFVYSVTKNDKTHLIRRNTHDNTIYRF